MYLPRIEPVTPMNITGHILRSKTICKVNMIVNAGRKGNGTTSNNKAPKNTNAYCHHITVILYQNLLLVFTHGLRDYTLKPILLVLLRELLIRNFGVYLQIVVLV